VGARCSLVADAPWGAQAPASSLVLIATNGAANDEANGALHGARLQREFEALAVPA